MIGSWKVNLYFFQLTHTQQLNNYRLFVADELTFTITVIIFSLFHLISLAIQFMKSITNWLNEWSSRWLNREKKSFGWDLIKIKLLLTFSLISFSFSSFFFIHEWKEKKWDEWREKWDLIELFTLWFIHFPSFHSIKLNLFHEIQLKNSFIKEIFDYFQYFLIASYFSNVQIF